MEKTQNASTDASRQANEPQALPLKYIENIRNLIRFKQSVIKLMSDEIQLHEKEIEYYQDQAQATDRVETDIFGEKLETVVN